MTRVTHVSNAQTGFLSASDLHVEQAPATLLNHGSRRFLTSIRHAIAATYRVPSELPLHGTVGIPRTKPSDTTFSKPHLRPRIHRVPAGIVHRPELCDMCFNCVQLRFPIALDNAGVVRRNNYPAFLLCWLRSGWARGPHGIHWASHPKHHHEPGGSNLRGRAAETQDVCLHIRRGPRPSPFLQRTPPCQSPSFPSILVLLKILIALRAALRLSRAGTPIPIFAPATRVTPTFPGNRTGFPARRGASSGSPPSIARGG